MSKMYVQDLRIEYGREKYMQQAVFDTSEHHNYVKNK